MSKKSTTIRSPLGFLIRKLKHFGFSKFDVRIRMDTISQVYQLTDHIGTRAPRLHAKTAETYHQQKWFFIKLLTTIWLERSFMYRRNNSETKTESCSTSHLYEVNLPWEHMSVVFFCFHLWCSTKNYSSLKH